LGNITDYERVIRLHKIDELNGEGKTDGQISEELGMSIMAVKRSQGYLKNLKIANLTPVELAEKRMELWLRLDKAKIEAVALFDRYKTPTTCKICGGSGHDRKNKEAPCYNCRGEGEIDKATKAVLFHKQWVDVIREKAKIYGFDSVKSGNTVNINQLYTSDTIPEKYSTRVAEKIRSAIIEDHEKKVQDA